MQYPASLLVLTANTLYKPSGVFFVLFFKKQASKATYMPQKKAKINTTSQEFTDTWAKKEDKAGL